MVTRVSESPLYIISSKQFPKSRVISVICHHGLAQGLPPEGLTQVAPAHPAWRVLQKSVTLKKFTPRIMLRIDSLVTVGLHSGRYSRRGET
jgi:hypothetical protein